MLEAEFDWPVNMSSSPKHKNSTEEATALLSDSDVSRDDIQKNDSKSTRSHYPQDYEKDSAAGISLLAEHENSSPIEEDSVHGNEKTLESLCLIDSSDFNKSRTPDLLPSNNVDNVTDNEKDSIDVKHTYVGKKPNTDKDEEKGPKSDVSKAGRKPHSKVKRPTSLNEQSGKGSKVHNFLISADDMTQRASIGMDPSQAKSLGPPQVKPKSKSTQDLLSASKNAAGIGAPSEFGDDTSTSRDPSLLSVLDKKAAFIEKADKQLPPTKAMRRRAEQERLDKVMYLSVMWMKIYKY